MPPVYSGTMSTLPLVSLTEVLVAALHQLRLDGVPSFSRSCSYMLATSATSSKLWPT